LHVDKSQVEGSDPDSQQPVSSFILQPSAFVLLLVFLASILIIIPDFVYLRDYFGYRINTVFKFYYQAWTLLSLAAAFGTVTLFKKLGRSLWSALSIFFITIVILCGLIYPVLALPNKTSNFAAFKAWDISPATNAGLFTLDSFDNFNRSNAEDAAAVRYLQSAPMGVVAEAVGGSYSGYARISTYSGLPAVIGWPWHEYQWRGSWDAHGTREPDIKTLYETPDWESARLIIERYHIRYIVVGLLERTTYKVSETKFERNLPVLFQAGSLVIYGAP
jgi:uncharacterized membrane protein